MPDADVPPKAPRAGRDAGALRRRRARRHHALSASSSTCRPSARPRCRPARTRPDPGQRVLVRGRPGAPAADPALHVVRHAAPPAAAGVRQLRLARVGHRRVDRPRHAVFLRDRALPPGALVRVPPAHRSHRARGGHPCRRQPRRASSASDITIGMPVRAEFVDFDDELSLPVFVPAGCGVERGADGLRLHRRAAGRRRGGDGLFAGLVDPDRVAAVEQSDERIDRDLWRALAGADLLGLAVPESRRRRGPRPARALPAARGAGQRRRTAAAVVHPRARRAAAGALRLRRPSEQRWLPGVVAGDTVLTAALTGPPPARRRRRPSGPSRTATAGSSTASSSPCPRRTSRRASSSLPTRATKETASSSRWSTRTPTA